MNEKVRTYMLDYPFRGGKYCLEMAADSWEDAEERLAAIKAWGKIEGEIYATIPVTPRTQWFGGLMARLIVWWKSRS